MERARLREMFARLTKISSTLSRYFHIAQVGSSVSGITSLCIRQPSSVPLQPDLTLVLNILNCVLIFKLSVVHCCTRATILIQGQLYQYSYRQISVTIHHRIDASNTALPSIGKCEAAKAST